MPEATGLIHWNCAACGKARDITEVPVGLGQEMRDRAVRADHKRVSSTCALIHGIDAITIMVGAEVTK